MVSPSPVFIKLLNDNAYSLITLADFDPLIKQIGEARLVLVGEASHGTSDFYTWHARLTQRLIKEKGFSFVAVLEQPGPAHGRCPEPFVGVSWRDGQGGRLGTQYPYR